MVDFQNETTIGTPAADIVRVIILQRRSDLFEAWESYKKKEHTGVDGGLEVVRARLETLFLELQPALKRRWTNKKKKDPTMYHTLKENIKSEDPEVIEETIHTLNDYLDEIRLIRIDTKSNYDSTNVEAEHKAKRM